MLSVLKAAKRYSYCPHTCGNPYSVADISFICPRSHPPLHHYCSSGSQGQLHALPCLTYGSGESGNGPLVISAGLFSHFISLHFISTPFPCPAGSQGQLQLLLDLRQRQVRRPHAASPEVQRGAQVAQLRQGSEVGGWASPGNR